MFSSGTRVLPVGSEISSSNWFGRDAKSATSHCSGGYLAAPVLRPVGRLIGGLTGGLTGGLIASWPQEVVWSQLQPLDRYG
jgi:hypothetical protein